MSFKYFSYIVILAMLSFIYIDYLSISSFGSLFSFVLFFIFIFISIKNLSLGILICIFYSIVVLEFPRDILDVYDALQLSNEMSFNVLNTVKISPFTLLVYLFFFNTILALYKMKFKIKNNRTLFLILGLMLFFAFISTLITLFVDGTIDFPSLIITNSKWFQFILIGYILGTYLYKQNQIKKFIDWLYLLPIFFGLRNIFFIGNDFITASPKLDLMNQPYLSLIVLVYIVIKKDWGIYNNHLYKILLFISLLNFSRGFIVIMVISLLLILFITFYKKIRFNLLFIFNIIILFSIPIFVLYLFNDRLFDFLLWKINIFNELTNSDIELSGSGKVRIIEMQNILYIFSENIYQLFFGKGFFATYNFQAFPLNDVGIIDLKSYSNDQLSSGVYYSTHSFISSTLLKYGLLGLVFYMIIPLYVSYKLYVQKCHLILILIPIILIPSYFWRIEFMLIIGILYGILGRRKNEIQLSNNSL